MKRYIGWLLFETRLGDRVLRFIEVHLGIGVLPVEVVDEAAMVLLQAIVS